MSVILIIPNLETGQSNEKLINISHVNTETIFLFPPPSSLPIQTNKDSHQILYNPSFRICFSFFIPSIFSLMQSIIFTLSYIRITNMSLFPCLQTPVYTLRNHPALEPYSVWAQTLHGFYRLSLTLTHRVKSNQAKSNPNKQTQVSNSLQNK